MANALEESSPEEEPPVQWRPSGCRRSSSRKSACSNIFSGLNLQQLQRLFRTAGDGNAEQRARLVWPGVDAGAQGAEQGGGGEGDEAELAQALVGLRVRARTRTGTRVDRHREQRWLRASSYLRVEESSPACTAEEDDEAGLIPGPTELQTEDGDPTNQNPFKWRLGVRLEASRDPEHYLHRILH